MSWVATAVVGGTIVGGLLSSSAQGSASRAQERSSEAAIREQRRARESFESRSDPFRRIGLQAREPLRELLGFGDADPLSQLEEINPLLSFLRQEGFEDIQETAAARGRLGAGGTLKDLTRFNTDLASTVVPQLQQQRFNQLFNLLGLGANVTAGQGTAGLSTANNISNLLTQQGANQAQGIISQGNIAGNTLGQLSSVFGAQQAGLFNQGQGQNPFALNSQLGTPVVQPSGPDFPTDFSTFT